ncbi:trypsin-like peptidase domain-containing protein [Oscillospiraceae bacterium OttesenSCG-928-F05]|nr:trypsin-like peptidase domain-containing protein [Oscillospiraceae bacterium OttesenSCG-928-F05]
MFNPYEPENGDNQKDEREDAHIPYYMRNKKNETPPENADRGPCRFDRDFRVEPGPSGTLKPDETGFYHGVPPHSRESYASVERDPVLYGPEADAAVKKKRRIPKALVIGLICLVAAGVGVTVFFMNYSISFGDDGTGFAMAIYPRRAENPQTDPTPAVSPGNTVGSQVVPVQSVSPAPENSITPGNLDGPSLVLQDIPPATATPVPIPGVRRELDVPEIAEKCLPSVVGIQAVLESNYGTSTSTGTGIIMQENGYIITNCHVIEGASQVSVSLNDERTFEARIIGKDGRSDLAVLKIEATGLTPAEFGNSDGLRVGELAVAIGNPLGLDLMGTVTDGIISAINRNVLVDERVMTLIQTNAAINMGNSGGPLCNRYGQVVGVTTLKLGTYNAAVEGLGFAIPSGTVKEIVDQLIQYGYVMGRPSIGIQGHDISAVVASYFGYPQGVLVDYINPLADVGKQGLETGDMIIGAQGQEIKTMSEINRIKEEYSVGDAFTLKVFRKGEEIEITFRLMDEAALSSSVEEVQMQPVPSN